MLGCCGMDELWSTSFIIDVSVMGFMFEREDVAVVSIRRYQGFTSNKTSNSKLYTIQYNNSIYHERTRMLQPRYYTTRTQSKIQWEDKHKLINNWEEDDERGEKKVEARSFAFVQFRNNE